MRTIRADQIESARKLIETKLDCGAFREWTIVVLENGEACLCLRFEKINVEVTDLSYGDLDKDFDCTIRLTFRENKK